MKELIKKYEATEATKIICIEDGDLTMSHILWSESTKMDLIAFLLDSEEDFWLSYCETIEQGDWYENTEIIWALYGQWYDKRKRHIRIGYANNKNELQGTFRIDNVKKRLLYNPYEAIATYDFWKVNRHCGLITNSSVQDIIKELVSQWYKIYNHTSIWNEELHIKQHPDRLKLLSWLESAFHKTTGKDPKELVIVWAETSLQAILKKEYPFREKIDPTQSVDTIIEQYSKSR